MNCDFIRVRITKDLVVNELEKMGDFMINISQDLYKSMHKASN